MESINFDKQYKVIISNPETAMRKHDTVKLLLVCELMYLTRKRKKYHLIYTEHPIGLRKFDVYHYDLLANKVTVYEIQNELTESWRKKLYAEIPDEIDIQIIPLKKLSNNFYELNKQVKGYVCV